MKLLWFGVIVVVLATSAQPQATNAVRMGVNIVKVAPTKYGFIVSVSVENLGSTPVSLAVTGFNQSNLQSLGIEQWDDDLGWQSVGPCHDVPPDKTIALKPGEPFTDEVPIGDSAHGFVSTICPSRVEKLQGSIRASLCCVYKSERDFQNRLRVPVQPRTLFYSTPFHLPDEAVRALALTGDGPTDVVKPTYPPDAKKAGVHGSVLINVTIAENGVVEKATVVSGPNLLTKAAVEAVRQWRYRPLIRDGKPVKRETTVAVRFVLPRGKSGLAEKSKSR